MKAHNFVENGSFAANPTAIEPQEPMQTICKIILATLRGFVGMSDANLQIFTKLRCSTCAGGVGGGGSREENQFWPFSLQNEGR